MRTFFPMKIRSIYSVGDRCIRYSSSDSWEYTCAGYCHRWKR